MRNLSVAATGPAMRMCTSSRRPFPIMRYCSPLNPRNWGRNYCFLLRWRAARDHQETFHPKNLRCELWPHTQLPNQHTSYPRDRQNAVGLALAEAWAWLEAQGLIVPDAGANGQNGWRRLSRRARRFESEAEFANYAAARMLHREAVHPKIADRFGTRSCAENSMSLASRP